MLKHLLISDMLRISYKDVLVMIRMIIFFLIMGLIFLWYKYNWEKYSSEEIEIKQNEKNSPKLESITEILNIAQHNPTHFWTYFQEVYPLFCTKLLKINPNLKVSELTFCAYIYLGFTTKEIATYTFKAVKTVENNRYNIRKKLKMSPEEDLTVWLRLLMKSV
ncbi:hypothetical protein CMU71_13910 [Elizabethkingia anophelis]|uniref:helix-turn-helix transcriptional regulator n=1 Tax=Elizabethkingia anophelis TaxID=1117645 RepID=UPI001F4B2A38|nr:LuxR C-terminal-related transcriptional regulator [Elizabethkingia anophelis]MDV3567991.1 hypothetical protein [Elizabethkingia anophelis]MDV3969625.1 hypothetical protein [Elizabethkingia anophelis]